MILSLAIYILILLIPFQLYFNFYKTFSVSIAQILAGLIFIVSLKKIYNLCKKIVVREYANKENEILTITVLIYILVMLLSIIVSDDKAQSLKYFIKWTSFMAIYFIAYANIDNISSLKKCLQMGFVVIGVTSLIGVCEYYQGFQNVYQWFSHSCLAPIIIEPETLKDKLIMGHNNWVIWGKELGLRVFSTFDCAIEFSAYLGLLLPFSIWIIKERRQIVYIPVIVLILSALLLNYTRSAYLSFLIVTAGLFILNYKHVNVKKVAIGIMFFVIILILSVSLNKLLREALEIRLNYSALQNSGRADVWLNGIKIFLSRPVLGVGVANYHNGLLKYIGANAVLLPAHNQYIQIAAETGVVGLISYCSILFVAIRYSFEVFRKTLDEKMRYIALGFIGMWGWYCIQSFFDTYLFGDKFSMMFWLMVGLNASLYRIYKNENKIVSGLNSNTR